eukprot:730155-Pelagomonas_calceolata.AAC.2
MSFQRACEGSPCRASLLLESTRAAQKQLQVCPSLEALRKGKWQQCHHHGRGCQDPVGCKEGRQQTQEDQKNEHLFNPCVLLQQPICIFLEQPLGQRQKDSVFAATDCAVNFRYLGGSASGSATTALAGSSWSCRCLHALMPRLHSLQAIRACLTALSSNDNSQQQIDGLRNVCSTIEAAEGKFRCVPNWALGI